MKDERGNGKVVEKEYLFSKQYINKILSQLRGLGYISGVSEELEETSFELSDDSLIERTPRVEKMIEEEKKRKFIWE